MSLFSPGKAAPVDDYIHAHCDGGSRGNPGPSGFGAVITDAQGHTLAELSEYLGLRTNNFAEYSGLLAVLNYAIEHKYPRLKVVSDSELMVKQIQGKYKINSPDLKPLWEQARARIAQLEAFEISHALRHKNKEADALANQAMDRGTRTMRRGAITIAGEEDLIPARRTAARAAATPIVRSSGGPAPEMPRVAERPPVLRGFTKDGAIHLLGGASLPDGVFVKITRE